MFFVPQREVERLTVRKRSGAYYTPKFISGFPATSCVDKYFANANSEVLPRAIERVERPSVASSTIPGAKHLPLFSCRRTEPSLKHRALLRAQPDSYCTGNHPNVES
jgi:hypothetical protein